MKKLYLALATMALAATLATGCGNKTGNTQADSRTETDSQSNKAGKKGPDINFEDYVHGVYSKDDVEKKDPSFVMVDLEGYLKAYGATEIHSFGLEYDDAYYCYGVKFKNGVVLALRFPRPCKGGENVAYIDRILVAACDPDYQFTHYSDIENNLNEQQEGLSSWNREIFIGLCKDMTGLDEYTYFQEREHIGEVSEYLVTRLNSTIYADVSEDDILAVPVYFDFAFKRYVVPYLDLEDVPFDKDPFTSDDLGFFLR